MSGHIWTLLSPIQRLAYLLCHEVHVERRVMWLFGFFRYGSTTHLRLGYWSFYLSQPYNRYYADFWCGLMTVMLCVAIGVMLGWRG